MSTWNQLIGLCLRDSGVAAAGLTPSSQMAQDTLTRLNMMLAQWAANRLYIFHLIDMAFGCTSAQSYTVGPGGNFPMDERPPKIEDAYLRQTVPAQPTPVDFPLRVTTAREDYDQLRLKSLKSAPSALLFYDPAYPLGNAFPWPVPNASWELHLVVRALLSQVVNPELTTGLPQMYDQAIYSNLIVAICAAHRREVHGAIAKMATTSMKTVKRANTQIPVSQMPRGLIRGGGAYNIFSDQGG